MPQTYDLTVDAGIDIISVSNNQHEIYDVTESPLGSGGRVSGIKKLIQRFTQVLLTQPKTSVTTPDTGSYFLEVLRETNIEEAITAMLSIRTMIGSVVQQIQAMERDDDPSDERLFGADISDPVFQDDKIGLGVMLVTQANEMAQFTLQIDNLMSL
jgi:hypothetical protein